VPQPLAVGSLSSGGAYLIMEGLKFRPFAMIAPERMSDLGARLARGHLRCVYTYYLYHIQYSYKYFTYYEYYKYYEYKYCIYYIHYKYFIQYRY
jgi:hypothetical protein